MRSLDGTNSFDVDTLVLGAGVSGLAAASKLDVGAVVLEREKKPGGLVQTDRIGSYWFDRVIHLLHFRDPETERAVRGLDELTLAPCPPEAFVETPSGVARFPVQLHLAGLRADRREACLADLRAAITSCEKTPRKNYREFLERSFGLSLCEEFFFPYNEKVWKRPLDQLAPNGFQWNIDHPSLLDAERGARDPEFRATSYNANGWYPRPAPGAETRGMESMSRALARRCRDIRLRRDVFRIDLARRLVHARVDGSTEMFRFQRACVSTLPLPTLIRMCDGVPRELAERIARLPSNRVVSAMLAIEGPRPKLGHWRYYADPSLAFGRLVFLHEFDPLLAPVDGWPLLAEITQRSESPLPLATSLLRAVERDARRVGAISADSRVVGCRMRVIDPAYVVFAEGVEETVARAEEFLEGAGVRLLGRYARWEYSSMAQVMRDGFALGQSLA